MEASAAVHATPHGIHPNWIACQTLEDLVRGITANASLRRDSAFAEDVRQALIRAQQLMPVDRDMVERANAYLERVLPSGSTAVLGGRFNFFEFLGEVLSGPAPAADSTCVASQDGRHSVAEQAQGKCLWCSEQISGHTANRDSLRPASSPRVFIDMDGVIVDFDRYRDERGLTGDQVKAMVGAYLDMPPIPGAIEAVRSLIGMGYEVWLATKPPTGVAHAYSDKAAWVLRHLPELKRRIIITHDKGLLGGEEDYLCDDRPHKANCALFRGTLVPFVGGYHWPQALDFFRQRRALRSRY